MRHAYLKESALTKLHHTAEARVKEMTLAEGFLHIDLFDGLRLTGPLRRPEGEASQSALVGTDPGSDWNDGRDLDGLMGDPA